MIPNDPAILLSFVNTKLRDFYSNLDALCADMNIDKEELCEKLAFAGFKYDEKQNMFF